MKWPLLQSFDQDHLERIAMPVGGIGTGTVSLGGRGDLRDWEIVNRPAKGFVPQGQGVFPFLALCVKDGQARRHVRLLEGPIERTDYEGALGSEANNHGFPRFRNCTFETAYPFGQVLLSDPSLPVKVALKVFNPLIPCDVASSSYPAAIIKVSIQNLSSEALETSVAFSIPNFIGEDGSQPEREENGVHRHKSGKRNRNQWVSGTCLSGIHLTAPDADPKGEQYGDLYLSTPNVQNMTFRTSWADLSWGDTKLDFWDDFSADGRLEERTSCEDNPVASLCVEQPLPAGETRELTFLVTWRFPNRQTWSRFGKEAVIVGNHYATCFTDAVDVAEKLYGALDGLEKKTLAFVHAVCASSLPAEVIQAALFNISTLRTQTCFRTPDGYFYGWEGCLDHQGSCPGSCTHVWNYEHATAFLFGELAKTMRQAEFLHATDERGHMPFRIELPLDRKPLESLCKNVAAADGQMGCIMKLYRDWQLSGDDILLRDLYPKAKQALEFCWIEGGWDADRDGLMEGCQHNTMDVEYYGPNPQMGFWYLGALRAMEEMSRHLGDIGFSAQCKSLCASGAQKIDEELFNGEYYEQRIESGKSIAEGLRLGLGASDPKNPELQLGAGCLVDQLVGQCTAHLLGLGHLSDGLKQRIALQTTFRCNFKEGFHDHFNHFRSFVLGDESGVLMATYPRGRRPERPFPYFNEVMTGFEYVLAVHLLVEGLKEEGLQIIRAIRERYDGKKRNPFNEAECGHHYARAMASWSALLALTGFRYSGVDKHMAFKAPDGSYFWSDGSAWGTCALRNGQVTLAVMHGILELKSFELSGVGLRTWPRVQRTEAGEEMFFSVQEMNLSDITTEKKGA